MIHGQQSTARRDLQARAGRAELGPLGGVRRVVVGERVNHVTAGVKILEDRGEVRLAVDRVDDGGDGRSAARGEEPALMNAGGQRRLELGDDRGLTGVVRAAADRDRPIRSPGRQGRSREADDRDPPDHGPRDDRPRCASQTDHETTPPVGTNATAAGAPASVCIPPEGRIQAATRGGRLFAAGEVGSRAGEPVEAAQPGNEVLGIR